MRGLGPGDFCGPGKETVHYQKGVDSILGLLSFHALQGQDYGRMGRIGFCIVLSAPLVAVLWPVGPLALSVGFVLYGVATLQTKVPPRWCGVAFIVALPDVLASGYPLPFSSIFEVFGVLWFALGLALLSKRVAPTERASGVR